MLNKAAAVNLVTLFSKEITAGPVLHYLKIFDITTYFILKPHIITYGEALNSRIRSKLTLNGIGLIIIAKENN